MSDENASTEQAGRGKRKSRNAFRTISEVSKDLDVPQHVLRFWESKFSQIKPMKRGGNRRYYRPEDVEILKLIRHRLYEDGYTIKGVQKLIKDQGIKATLEAWRNGGDTNVTQASPQEDTNDTKVEPNIEVSADIGTVRDVLAELKALRASLN